MRVRTKPILRSLVAVQLTAVALACSATRQSVAQSASSGPDCPTHGAVAESVRALLDRSHIEVKNLESKFEIRNGVQGFSVVASGRSRDFDDPTQDCVGRTRAAAVFVALTLAPPDVGLASNDNAVPPSPPATPTRVSRAVRLRPAGPRSAIAPAVGETGRRWRLGVEVGGVLQASPSGPNWRKGLGAEVRMVLTKPTWGWTIGTQLQTADNLELRASDIQERRIPMDFGLRWTQIHGWGTTFVDMVGVLALSQLRQVNSSSASPVRRVLDLGARTAIGLYVGRSTFSPVFRVSAEVYPAPQAITVDPTGKIGTTSWLWIGAAVGLAGNFH